MNQTIFGLTLFIFDLQITKILFRRNQRLTKKRVKFNFDELMITLIMLPCACMSPW